MIMTKTMSTEAAECPESTPWMEYSSPNIWSGLHVNVRAGRVSSCCIPKKVCHWAYGVLMLWIFWRYYGGYCHNILLSLLLSCTDGEARLARTDFLRHLQRA